jgi:hypothetical protein
MIPTRIARAGLHLRGMHKLQAHGGKGRRAPGRAQKARIEGLAETALYRPIIVDVRVIAKSFLVAWLVLALAWLPAARAENPAPDSDQSGRLTDFLHSHHLPLVGAQVLNSRGGGQSVLLYGYTATELGKSNAEKRTRLFLKDSEIPITNRIRVEPQLASMHSPSAAPPPASGPPPESAAIPPASGEMGGVDSYQNQQANDAQQQYGNQQAQQYQNQQAQQYMNQQNSTASWATTLIPLIGMGLAIGLGGSGSGFGMGVQPGFGSSNPYGGGFGNPYGGGYGNPYGGGYGGAGNPYGNPYAPSPYGPPAGGSPYP